MMGTNFLNSNHTITINYCEIVCNLIFDTQGIRNCMDSKYLFDLAISYARPDEEFALKIFNGLSGEFKVFCDINQYELLVCKYLHEILYDVFYRQAEFALMIISSSYMSSPHTMWEARNIIAKSIDNKNNRYFIISDGTVGHKEICEKLFIPENDYLFYDKNLAEDNIENLFKILRQRIKKNRNNS